MSTGKFEVYMSWNATIFRRDTSKDEKIEDHILERNVHIISALCVLLEHVKQIYLQIFSEFRRC